MILKKNIEVLLKLHVFFFTIYKLCRFERSNSIIESTEPYITMIIIMTVNITNNLLHIAIKFARACRFFLTNYIQISIVK